MRKGAIGQLICQHVIAHSHDSGKPLLQLYSNINTLHHEQFFQHRDLRKKTRNKNYLAQWPLLDFCIVSADFYLSVLDVLSKRVQNCQLITTYSSLKLSLEKAIEVLPNIVREAGGQGCKKHL